MRIEKAAREEDIVYDKPTKTYTAKATKIKIRLSYDLDTSGRCHLISIRSEFPANDATRRFNAPRPAFSPAFLTPLRRFRD
ncbi:hypothetical protein EVAR_59879_1 [Eumeta japonica]|uniref:Uncharacterized protein n=1 Tax=Eumeta variegata TaxID=151549 RepID=A0A4C1XNU9_EUMVA|nr:hypothetical protein EVAR_59879_1 [Eumeta japonica]